MKTIHIYGVFLLDACCNSINGLMDVDCLTMRMSAQ